MDNLEIVVLAAGKGTRMKSELPKVLHKVCGSTLLMRTLRAVDGVSPSRIVTVLGFGRELCEAEIGVFSEISKTPVIVADQKQQNGTGHATQVGLEKVSTDAKWVLVIPGDTPLLSTEVLVEFINAAEQHSAKVSILSCEVDDPSGFGRVSRDSSGEVQAIVEDRDCTEEQLRISEINTSMYLVARDFLEDSLSKVSGANAQGELYLTDIVGIAKQSGETIFAHTTGCVEQVLGANTRVELSELEQYRRNQINQELMYSGVSFEDPQRTYVDEGVRVGADSFLGANTRLKGCTSVGAGVVIEGDSLIEDSQIADNCLIRLGSYINQSKVAENSQIGPHAQLRPGTVLDAGVKVGNFVEIKNAHLAAGAKANHLSYIGDADVGAGSNIGAGTIFCNYDGKNKHRSTLGENVFIGSNSVLVAPVSIAANAYIGAGSAITKNVPEGALGIARGKQSNIDGWVDKKNKKKD